MDAIEQCKTIRVYFFRGNRSPSFIAGFKKKIQDDQTGLGAGPTLPECLLYSGHAGISFDLGLTIYGFNPDPSGNPVWLLMQKLSNGDAIQGHVTNDTSIFSLASATGLNVVSIQLIFPKSVVDTFELRVNNEILSSQFRYGFPDGDGDCNCITWIERIGIPLLTGRASEFEKMWGVVNQPSRRFGQCI